MTVVVKINQGKPNERVIGLLDTVQKVFKKSIYGSKHILKVIDAIGIDAQYFEEVLLPNNYKIEVWEREENVIYETTAEEMKKHGQYFHFKEEDKDHRAQIFLPRAYWKKRDAEEEKAKYEYYKYLV